MKRTPAHVVGSRVDWLTWSARVVLVDELVPLLRARGLVALREDTPVPIALGRFGFELLIPGRSGKWILRNADVRLVVLEHGAGRAAEGDPGWDVQIDCSGVALLAFGYDGAIDLFWEIGRALGDVLEARVGRIDLCADVAGYRLRADDRHSFVKQRRVTSSDRFSDGRLEVETRRQVERPRSGDAKKLRTTTGERAADRREHWHIDARKVVELVDEGDGTEAVMYSGDHFSGFTFGSRTAVSARIYDKVLQLKAQPPDKRAAERAEWRRNGWDPDESVTRVEFEVRGEALGELGLRLATRGEQGPEAQRAGLRAALDPVWAYMTQKWLRLVRRGEPDVVQPRWRVVQAVTWQAAAEPRKRERKRSAARAAQAFGCAVSMQAAAGELEAPWSPRVFERVDPETGEVLEVVDAIRANEDEARFVEELLERREATEPERADQVARGELARIVQCVADGIVGPIVEGELERAKGSGVQALARVYAKIGAALQRFRTEAA